MKKIAFSNFRRFENLGPLSLGRVTLLSGGNNSGKSTIVKAAVLAVSYLKSKKMDYGLASPLLVDNSSKKFFFDIDNTHISSFKRALNNNCDVKYDNIKFELGLEDFDFNIYVKASEFESNTYGFVSILRVLDNKVGIEYVFDFDKATMTISFLNDESKEVVKCREEIEQKIAEIQAEINSSTDLETISKLNMNLLENKKQLEILSKKFVVEEPTFVFTLSYFASYSDLYSVVSHIRAFIAITKEKSEIAKDEKSKKVGREYILSKEGEISDSINRLKDVLNYTDIEFIGAHAASQEAVLSIRDNTYPAITIHEFCKSGIGHKDDENGIVIGQRKDVSEAEAFIVDQMRKFSVGSSARILIHNNEAYEFFVTDEEGKEMPLADKGMGTIQLVILILRMATLISQYKYARRKPLVLIEEPEQNLHPKLQSLLADFFFLIGKEYGFQIIVETHSEYMVRKMQVLFAKAVKEDGISDEEMNNDIKVYFFPESCKPYSMTFRANGRFENSFGAGFFDEAGRWNRELNVIENS